MQMFTIYKNPTDFPGKFVVREQTVDHIKIQHAATPLAVVDTLNEARRAVPFGLVCLERYPDDDPVIVEVWF